MATEDEQTVENFIDLGVLEQASQTIDYIVSDDPKSLKAIKDYFELLIEKLKAFDISAQEEFTNDLFFQRTKQMIPLRNEVVNIITAIAEFQEQTKFYTEIHSFFERLLPYFGFRDEGENRQGTASDHYKVFGYELFIYAVAALLKYQRFEQLNELTQQGYLMPSALTV
jgi:hypothetical protein